MTNIDYGNKLYSKIISIQKLKKITTTKIAKHLGIGVSTVSYRILAMQDGEFVSLETIKAIEELSGEVILNI